MKAYNLVLSRFFLRVLYSYAALGFTEDSYTVRESEELRVCLKVGLLLFSECNTVIIV